MELLSGSFVPSGDTLPDFIFVVRVPVVLLSMTILWLLEDMLTHLIHAQAHLFDHLLILGQLALVDCSSSSVSHSLIEAEIELSLLRVVGGRGLWRLGRVDNLELMSHVAILIGSGG